MLNLLNPVRLKKGLGISVEANVSEIMNGKTHDAKQRRQW